MRPKPYDAGLPAGLPSDQSMYLSGVSFAPIPEPSTALLAGLAGLGLLGRRRIF